MTFSPAALLAVLLPGGEWTDVLLHLSVALVSGGLIGIEPSYHGRPAGFRTHTLVCMASSLLMLVTVYQELGSRAPARRRSASTRRAWPRGS